MSSVGGVSFGLRDRGVGVRWAVGEGIPLRFLFISSVSMRTLTGPGARGTTSIRFGSCFLAASLFNFSIPSMIVIRLWSPVDDPARGTDEIDAPRLCPFTVTAPDTVPDIGGTFSEAVRFLLEPCRPSEEGVTTWVVVGVHAGALAELRTDCFETDEFRESDVC